VRSTEATDATVIILHPAAGPDAGPLTRAVAGAREAQAERHVRLATQAGAAEARVVAGPPDGTPFGARLRGLVDGLRTSGLVILGSGAVPLATVADHAAFVAAASGPRPTALANNRYSADIVAIACARETLAGLPDLAADNALPRWLAEVAGVPLDDLRARWRLALDIDGPLDLVLLGGRWAVHLARADRSRVEERLAAVRRVAADPSAELLVAGRTSASTLAWLERATASRTRAFVEERGLRTTAAGQRAPASVLGAVLDRDAPASLGRHLARLGEAAIVDTRVLLAHRLGADEARWPTPEDRYASDLLLHERIADPWLRKLTSAAAEAPIPVLLGGHTLVGPGLRLALRARRKPGTP
jgi:hypothetical protein